MKVFTLVGFAAHLGKMAVELPHVQHAALEAAAVVVETEAKRVLGTYDYGWPQTQRGDSPLLDTGEMRDSIQHNSSPTEAHIGSNNDKAVWQELGTSRGIPPRSFLGAALHEKAPEAVAVIGGTIGGFLEKSSLDEKILHMAWDAVKHIGHEAKKAFDESNPDKDHR